MKEKIVSPGVFSKEIDETFLPAAVGDIGAVVIGPTARGPALVPTVVSSYSEYQKYFGDSHLSGSDYYQHLTAHTAQSYLRNAGKLTVVKILAGSYTGASVSISSSINPQIVGGGTNEVGGPQIGATTVKFALNPDQTHHQRTATKNVLTASIGEVDFYFVTQSALMAASGSSTRQYVVTASTAAHTANVFRDYINVTGSHTAHAWKGYLTASTNGAQVYISSSVPGALFSTASKSASMAGAASQTVYHGFNAREAFGLTDVTYLTLSTGSSTAHASIHPLIGFSGSLSGSMDNKKHQKVVFKLNTIADGSDQTSYSETNPNFPVKSSAFGKNGILKQVVPNYHTRKNYYTKAWDLTSNKDIMNIAAVIQKFVDMSMSTNLYYNYSHYEDGNIPLSELIKDQIYGYKLGLKNFYYANTPDGDGDTEKEMGCESGACAI